MFCSPRLPRLSKWMLRIVSRDYGDGVDTIVKGEKWWQITNVAATFSNVLQGRNLRKIAERNYGKYKRSTFFMADDNIVKGSGHKCYHLLQTQKRIGTDIVINICEYIRIINFSYKIKMQGKLSFGVKEYFVHLHNLV